MTMLTAVVVKIAQKQINLDKSSNMKTVIKFSSFDLGVIEPGNKKKK
jgi:hypothetical protein